ncbi:FliH/SctL family protein [Achromobacter sp. AGC78]
MKTAPILRQMPVAPSSRRLGPAAQLPPRLPASSSNASSSATTSVSAAQVKITPPVSEAEIEQRALAIAQRMMRAEIEQVRKGAREEGLAAGRDEGLRAAEVQVSEHLLSLQTRFEIVTEALAGALDRERVATEDAALELTMAALARILGQSPEAESVAAIVRQAGSQLRDPTRVRVRMAPADIELLQAANVLPLSLVPQAADVQWVQDPAIEGGCILQTETGNLDARLLKQVTVLEDALMRVYRARGHQA